MKLKRLSRKLLSFTSKNFAINEVKWITHGLFYLISTFKFILVIAIISQEVLL
jgi:hypothetical protein